MAVVRQERRSAPQKRPLPLGATGGHWGPLGVSATEEAQSAAATGPFHKGRIQRALLFGITSNTLVRPSQSSSGPAGGRSDGCGLGRGAAGPDRRCTTTAAGALRVIGIRQTVFARREKEIGNFQQAPFRVKHENRRTGEKKEKIKLEGKQNRKTIEERISGFNKKFKAWNISLVKREKRDTQRF